MTRVMMIVLFHLQAVSIVQTRRIYNVLSWKRIQYPIYMYVLWKEMQVAWRVEEELVVCREKKDIFGSHQDGPGKMRIERSSEEMVKL